MSDVVWQPQLIEKYNTSGPRYTSYPTALSFHEGVGRQAIEQAWQLSDKQELSLYIHLPFCHTLCYYCGCNKLVTRHPEKIDDYLDVLLQEIDNLPASWRKKPVSQIHLGGGTPSYLSAIQCERLMTAIYQAFPVQGDAEISMEIDPRELEENYLQQLKRLGFNRLSLGVQDFAEEVQIAVNRQQSYALVEQLMRQARELGFNSINLDLIYGLPHQTEQSFKRTLEMVLQLDPDRLSVFNYAHLPQRFAAQRKIKEQYLPSSECKLAILRQSIESLTQAGYQFIGMDHFAKPDDPLAKAQKDGVLHRNFQGYTTHQNCDLLGLGVSSISQIGNSFGQNQKQLKDYYQSIASSGHAHDKGYLLSADDLLRQRVIRDLICNMQLNITDIEQEYQIDFVSYFADAQAQLEQLQQDGLITMSEQQIVVSQTGKLLIRNICMCFDAYVKKTQNQRFSKVI